MSRTSRRPLVLAILDGIGVSEPANGNAVSAAHMPHYAALREQGHSTTLAASGVHVGLPEGHRGSGEAGHRTLGAGRVVPSAHVRIEEACAQNKLSRNPALDQLMRTAAYDGATLHLIGLLSDASVHSALDHWLALIDLATHHGLSVVIHAILDGVDTTPRAAAVLLDKLDLHLEGKNAVVGTLAGRHYAMDTVGRWERTHLAFHAIVRDNVLGPSALHAPTVFDALRHAYAQGLTDAYVEPTRIGDYRGLRGDFVCDFSGSPPVWEWTGEDCGLVVGHRGDGLRQLTQLLAREDVPEEVSNDLLMDRHHPVRAFREHCLLTLVPMSSGLSVPVAFPGESISGTLGEALSRAGRTQLRVAESDRQDHMTTFFGSDRDVRFPGESVEFIPSPRLLERYDDKPELQVARVAERVVQAVEEAQYDVIFVNLGNAERVAGTGNLEATRLALEALDAALGKIAAVVSTVGGTLLLTADHGGCEALLDARGYAHGPHSTNPVPFTIVGADLDGMGLRSGGGLADVAPTVLALLGVACPAEMTGSSLLVRP
jgi:2,3-bisphosphoglycerate-independent phosphoglycerate mutase